MRGWLTDSHLSLAQPAPGLHLREPPLRARQAGHARAARRLQHAAHARPLSRRRWCSSRCRSTRSTSTSTRRSPRCASAAAAPCTSCSRAAVQARLRDQRSDDRAPDDRRSARRRRRRFRCAWPRPAASMRLAAPLRLVDAPPGRRGRRLPLAACARRRCPRPVRAGRRRAAGFFAALRPLGQVFEGYLVCEGARPAGPHRPARGARAGDVRAPARRLRAAAWCRASSCWCRRWSSVGPREAALLGEQVDTLDARRLRDRALRRQRVRGARRAGAARRQPTPCCCCAISPTDLAEVGRSRRVDQAAEAVLARLACHSAVRVGQQHGPGSRSAPCCRPWTTPTSPATARTGGRRSWCCRAGTSSAGSSEREEDLDDGGTEQRRCLGWLRSSVPPW